MKPGGDSRSKRVLIVDDDSEQLANTAKYLSRAGFSVITCEDGDEAIAAMEGMDFDAVVSDVQMPRVNGLSLVEWVATNRPGIRVVVMTAFGSAELYKKAMKRGAALYLEKPVDPKLLVELLDTRTEKNESNDELVSSCMEAQKREGGGEVVVRLGDRIGRIFFTDGKVAWAAVTSSPSIFLETLYIKTGLEKTIVESVYKRCQRDGSNIVDQLVVGGHVNEMVMRKVLLSSIVKCVSEMNSWKESKAMYLPMRRPFSGKFTFELADVLAAAEDEK